MTMADGVPVGVVAVDMTGDAVVDVGDATPLLDVDLFPMTIAITAIATTATTATEPRMIFVRRVRRCGWGLSTVGAGGANGLCWLGVETGACCVGTPLAVGAAWVGA